MTCSLQLISRQQARHLLRLQEQRNDSLCMPSRAACHVARLKT